MDVLSLCNGENITLILFPKLHTDLFLYGCIYNRLLFNTHLISLQCVFIAEQLMELRKVRLSSVLCRNGDNITHIQPYVMEVPFDEAFSNDE